MRVEYNDNKVLIHYNLTDTIAGRSYIVRVYSSTDNYLNPLRDISGDVGFEINPGLNKKIVWDPVAELGDSFDGKVALKIRARVFIPFITFGSVEEYKTFTRGRSYDITWSGGTAQNILNFDLYHGETKIASFPNIANVGHYKLTLPLTAKPRQGYRFKISDSKNKDEVVNTGQFGIKRKIPLSLKLGALLLLSSTTYYLLMKPEPNDALPWPVDID